MAADGPAERGIVEVAFALPGKQRLVEVEAVPGLTVGDAIDRSAIATHFPGVDFDQLDVGVWGRVVTRQHPVAAGDRVELYRPLEMDPREARRRRAEQAQ